MDNLAIIMACLGFALPIISGWAMGFSKPDQSGPRTPVRYWAFGYGTLMTTLILVGAYRLHAHHGYYLIGAGEPEKLSPPVWWAYFVFFALLYWMPYICLRVGRWQRLRSAK